jgi:methionyl aminopeptidase
MNELERAVAPGATTEELNRIASELIRSAGASALFLGVRSPQARFPFPASICSSLNEEVVHGIPDNRRLKDGDILSVDCGVRLRGYCGDHARTFAIGAINKQARKLLDVTRTSLDLAIQLVKPGERWSRIARQIQAKVESAGFNVVREFVGHGVGREMHEEPKVPNYWDRSQRSSDFELTPGMVIAIEPMVVAGRYETDFRDASRWTVVTKDRSLAAHFEHTVAVTTTGADVLTDGRG